MKNYLFLLIWLSCLSISAQNCVSGTSYEELDINNVRAALLNAGDVFHNILTGQAGYEVPKVTDSTQIRRNMIYTAALWIGGVDAANHLYASAETYRNGSQSYFPGPIVHHTTLQTASSECLEWDRHFKVNRSMIESFNQRYASGNIHSISDVPDEILFWPGKENPYLSLSGNGESFAPFTDLNSDGTYNPLHGDYPKIMGDQSVWWIMNDVGGEKQLGDGLVVDPMGIEIQVEAFAFATEDVLNDVTFQKYTLINRSSTAYYDTYCGFMVDGDIGNYDDDYAASDVERGMGIFYNGKPIDAGFAGYGSNPPALGIDFVKGIEADPDDGIDNNRNCITDEANEDLMMSNFMVYFGDFNIMFGNPSSKSDYYNYIKGRWKNGMTIRYDGKNGRDMSVSDKADFMFPGDSDLDPGWNFGGDCAQPDSNPVNQYWSESTAANDPSDRRAVMGMGPFTFRPGESKEFVMAIVYARDSNNVNGSVAALKAADDVVQQACDHGFQNYISSIEEITDVSFAQIFPTVFSDRIHIEWVQPGSLQFRLLDITGKTVVEKQLNAGQDLDLSPIRSGIYYYQLIYGERIQSGKLIKL